MYSFEQSANELNIKIYLVQKKCIEFGFKLYEGRMRKKYLSETQLNILKHHYSEQISTGNTIEVIKVTETFYIYESKINNT